MDDDGLRDRCKEFIRVLSLNAFLRQGSPVDDLAAFVTAEMRGAWQPIEAAPDETPVIVLTARGRAFKAMRAFHGDDIGMAWVTCEENDPCPPCWTDGMCWYSNDDGETSDQPVLWMPIPSQGASDAA